ncbi:CHC2 zinc finger domain-containing protein, partial [Lentibacter algarum]|uniref:CHC2 zinc finger domain-containing protein n=1 Tax=Lentibacter algarum TaxID=576131 RepID=UPI0035C81212
MKSIRKRGGSLYAYTEKNVFQCFSCKAKGNVLDFVASIEGASVRDAAKVLMSINGGSTASYTEKNGKGDMVQRKVQSPLT